MRFVTCSIVAAFSSLVPGTIAQGAAVSGQVRSSIGAQPPIASARVTLFTPDLAFFREVRTGAMGDYVIADVPPGDYALGVSALRLEYEELAVTVAASPLVRDFALGPETEPGRWDIIGNTLPEFFDATDIAILRSDGKVFYCHNPPQQEGNVVSATLPLDADLLPLGHHLLFAMVDDIPSEAAILRVDAAFGDHDADGNVDLLDFSSFSECLTGPDSAPQPQPPLTPQACLASFDSELDSDVDAADFGAFQASFMP